MKPADFHPEAAIEAKEAAERYAGIRKGLGADYRAELRAAIKRIRTNPLLYAVELDFLRIAPLQRFPYSLIYEALPDRIWIAAVAHQSRRPGYWSHRQK